MYKSVEKNQREILKLKSVVTEIKNSLEELNSRFSKQKNQWAWK